MTGLYALGLTIFLLAVGYFLKQPATGFEGVILYFVVLHRFEQREKNK